MKNGVLDQGQSGIAVHLEFHRSSVSVEEITKQSNKLERLSRSGGGCYVLGLAAGQGHHLLLDRLPANEGRRGRYHYTRQGVPPQGTSGSRCRGQESPQHSG
jgi:hypothetical protein